MRITLDQPTFLTALTAKNANPENASTDPNFLNFLTELLATELPAEGSLQETSLPLPTLENESNATDTTGELSEDATATLDNLLIGMNYLAQANAPAPTQRPIQPPTQTPVKADATIETDALPATSPTLQEASTPLSPSAVLPSATSLAVMTPTLNTIPTTTMKLPEKESMKLTDKSALFNRDALVRQDESTRVDAPTVLNTRAPSTLVHEDKITQTFNQLADWMQGKINADPNLAVIPLPSTHRSVAEREIQTMMTGTTTVNGAATPANAAWEAKVEVQQTVSNSEINLAHYQANIKIYPPELGKVSARLKMDKNSATLVVAAETKEVKALIETNLAGLREQFANANITLDRIEVTLADNKANANTDANARRETKQEKSEGYSERTEAALPKASARKQKQSENAVDAYV